MKKYWLSIDQKNGTSKDKVEAKKNREEEIAELFDENVAKSKSSRRDFLKLCGFAVGTAAIAASCENPVKKAIPLLNRPEELVPGKANYYASSYIDGNDYCSVLVKVRDGRPIKIEGNSASSVTKGKTNARAQASVLSLYDGSARYEGPKFNGKEINWEQADKAIIKKLKDIVANEGKVVLLSSTIYSPTTTKAIEEFIAAYPGSDWIQYDPVSSAAMLDANKEMFGQRIIPSYHFDKADVIVSFAADFLGSWISPIEFANQYAQTRKLDKNRISMSKHYQFESGMSLTGSNADYRYQIKPSEEGLILINLYNEIAKTVSGYDIFQAAQASVDVHEVAEELIAHKGKTLVVSGTNNIYIQYLVNTINQMLENYGQTIDLHNYMNLKQGDDKAVIKLVDDMNKGNVDALLVYNANPVYDYPDAEKFKTGLKKVALSVSFAHAKDETAAATHYILPDHHYLESWNDAEPKKNVYSLAQPAIRNIFDTRQVQESLLAWAGNTTSYHEYLKNNWKENILVSGSFSWNEVLQNGDYEKSFNEEELLANNSGLSNAVSNIKKIKASGVEIVLHESNAIGNGKHANNPWLMELPDPITKLTWDNVAAVSPKYAEELGVANESVIDINGITFPVLVQPGQAYGTISIGLGYGRLVAGKVAEKVGKNAYGFVKPTKNGFEYANSGLTIKKTIEQHVLALTQEHHSMEGREIVRETTLKQYLKDPYSGNEKHIEVEKHHQTLYPETEFPGHHWGLAVDLTTCIGCSACAVACQAENNIPVIGKQEVKNRRIMHWIRIDRYYTGEEDNPGVVHQPLMCQHCDNAPCENVCPVSATMHSNEGLNQMAYNRCVGTKYCINNCPYKVRRFNWYRYVTNEKFDYNMNDDLGRMVLNPDVVVRERGVVEKCSFCVQRIQEKKLEAKLENRKVKDGEIQPACVQACPSEALIFGDLNDKESKVSKAFETERNYHLLEELHTLPSVGYLTKVRNKEPEAGTLDKGHAHH